MFGIPNLDIEIDDLTAKIAKRLNLSKMMAILGDQPPGSTTPAQLYDATIPGNVWILEVTSNGYSTKKSVRGPTSSTVAMRAGQPVLLKYDIDGKLAVDKIDFTAVQAAGGNPLQNNASDGQANAFVATSSITTLICTPTAPPSLNVALFGWKPVIQGTIYDFPGALIDLSSFVPSAGNHCVAVIFVKPDLATVEVFASTAKSTSDPLTIIGDLQETISQSTSGSTPAWVWRLHDGQASIVDADRLMDLRNPWNVDNGGNIVKLATVTGVDMNTATPTALYTVPTGRSVIITSVTVHNASTSLTTASYSFGFNSAAFNNVIADATHTELTGSTLYTILNAKAGAKVGVAADVLKVLMNTLQGGAATTTMDVFGYLI